jgi:hypothetical protein
MPDEKLRARAEVAFVKALEVLVSAAMLYSDEPTKDRLGVLGMAAQRYSKEIDSIRAAGFTEYGWALYRETDRAVAGGAVLDVDPTAQDPTEDAN